MGIQIKPTPTMQHAVTLKFKHLFSTRDSTFCINVQIFNLCRIAESLFAEANEIEVVWRVQLTFNNITIAWGERRHFIIVSRNKSSKHLACLTTFLSFIPREIAAITKPIDVILRGDLHLRVHLCNRCEEQETLKEICREFLMKFSSFCVGGKQLDDDVGFSMKKQNP